MANSQMLSRIRELLPADRFSVQVDQLAVASRDESTLPGVIPLIVVWPSNADEISAIVSCCAESGTPITTRGAGSALEGSAIPSQGGLVLDVSRMTEIIDFWPNDLQVSVQPGLIYDKLNEHLKRDGLFFPPSPGGSADIATIGGMVSTNASGIYSVKYGGTSDYVLALDVVTGTGEHLRLGNRSIKRSSGYNLVDLIAGSEGTLAIITKITLRLAGIPEERLQTAFKFPTELDAAKAVSEMRRYAVDLAAVEFLDRRLMGALNKLKGYGLEEVPALFLEFHGPRQLLESNSDLAASICNEAGGCELFLPDGQQPWEIRHWATEAVKQARRGYTIIRNDVAFPISNLPEMVEFCYKLGDEGGISIYTFGHVGMGLLHALMLARPKEQTEWRRAQKINERIIEKAIELGGTISGEHGIGLGHKGQFHLEHGKSVELMRKIKAQFDPQSILNPGKIFDP